MPLETDKYFLAGTSSAAAEGGWKGLALAVCRKFFGPSSMETCELPGCFVSSDGPHGVRRAQAVTMNVVSPSGKVLCRNCCGAFAPEDADECYKCFLDLFSIGLVRSPDGKTSPKIRWNTREELALKLGAYGYI